ncbi:MAG: NAD(P)-dependent oxidoreductase [Alphaproteobacteria bacterium]|nr:NAD(P)-dependent oxidoreductase [Alphaproteobacteria bacterium]
MTVLITGAGLLATHAGKALADGGERIVYYDVAPSEAYVRQVMDDRPYTIVRGDVLDMPHLMHTIAREKVTGLVHSAAFLPETARERPFMATRVTVEGTVNTLEAHRLAGLGRYVLCSTIGIYDASVDTGRAMEEDQPIGPDSFYGCLKLSSEVIALHYQKAYGVDVMAPRFCPVYGLGQWYSSGGAIFMARCIEGPALGRAVVIDKPFSNVNQYLYVLDAAQAIERCYRVRDPAERAINIGSGALHSAPDVIETVKKVIPGARIDIDPAAWASSKDRVFVRQPFSLARARAVLGFTPAFTLEAAIADYAAKVRRRAQQPV